MTVFTGIASAVPVFLQVNRKKGGKGAGGTDVQFRTGRHQHDRWNHRNHRRGQGRDPRLGSRAESTYGTSSSRFSPTIRAVVFEALQKAGVAAVHIDFDGCGDEGTIDSVSCPRWSWRHRHSRNRGRRWPCRILRHRYPKHHEPGERRRRGRLRYPDASIMMDGKTTTVRSANSASTSPAGTISYEHHERYTEVETFGLEL